MESLWNDVVAFLHEVINLPPETFVTYVQMMFFPFSYFNNWELDWGIEYFGSGLALIAFLFSYTIPSKEYSKNPLAKWLMQIPMSKLMGLLSKGGILYLSMLWFLPGILCFLPFSLFSGADSFIPHLKALVHSIGTVYLTVSFFLTAEHLVMKTIKQVSILEAWKTTMAESKESEHTTRNDVLRTKRHSKKVAGETFWERSNRYADSGVEASSPFWDRISKFQNTMVVMLIVYGSAHPLFCLSILHL